MAAPNSNPTHRVLEEHGHADNDGEDQHPASVSQHALLVDHGAELPALADSWRWRSCLSDICRRRLRTVGIDPVSSHGIASSVPEGVLDSQIPEKK